MHRERPSQEFEERRDHLRKLALGILGCRADADDAVQETWLRLARSDAEAIDNPAGWLTTVTSRVSLDTLRAATRDARHSLLPTWPSQYPRSPTTRSAKRLWRK